jgi:hypothetical protein
LQSLTFIECNVYLSLLEVALSLPKALKELCINERLHIWRDCLPNGTTRTTHPKFLDVLQKQADSLERLVHNSGNVHHLSPARELDAVVGPVPTMEEASKLCNLTSLKYLELSYGGGCLAWCLKLGAFPGSLKTLRLNDSTYGCIRRYRPGDPESNEILLKQGHKIAVVSTPKPLNLELCYTHGKSPPDIAALIWWNKDLPQCQENRLKVYDIALVLKARGARLRISIERFLGPHSYIPPYMYGEEEPSELVVYDSEKPWRFNGGHARELDRDVVHPSLWAVCFHCSSLNQECQNDGYGTECVRCRWGNSDCEYPPMASPWAVRDVAPSRNGHPLAVPGRGS